MSVKLHYPRSASRRTLSSRASGRPHRRTPEMGPTTSLLSPRPFRASHLFFQSPPSLTRLLRYCAIVLLTTLFLLRSRHLKGGLQGKDRLNS
ncbi:unnamed protein product [Alopecurus aequalis]